MKGSFVFSRKEYFTIFERMDFSFAKYKILTICGSVHFILVPVEKSLPLSLHICLTGVIYCVIFGW
jgi:hypothetical protein